MSEDQLTDFSSAYPLASLGYANWVLRHFGYKTVFILGLCLYGVGALCMWPAGLNQSFGGFCGATFVIGSGLGSLETAANPYLTGMCSSTSHYGSNHRAIVLLIAMQSAVHRATLKSVSISPSPSMLSAPSLALYWARTFSSQGQVIQ